MSDLVLLDVSQFQPGIDHAAVVAYLRRTYGGAVIISRLCYGDLLVDTQADANIDGFRAAGADALGWYLYLVAGRDPAAQAATLGRVLLAHGGLRRNEFVVVDDEESTGGDESPRVDAALAELDQQLQTADPAGEDWWYSGLNFAATHDLADARGRRWIAAYQGTEPTSIAHDLWQRTDAATVPGINGPVDASVFHGTLSNFLALIGAGSSPAPVPPPAPREEEDMSSDVAYVDLNVQTGWQYLMWADTSGQLWLWGYHDQDGTKAGAGPVPGVPQLVPRAPLSIHAVDSLKQLQVAARAADGSAVHLVQGYGASDVLKDWSVERYGNADGGMPVPPAVSAALAALTSGQAALKQELDTVAGAVASGQPPNLTALAQALASNGALLAALSAHLGVGTA